MDQNGCVFIPRVVVVPAGGTVDFLNSDRLLHNIHATPKLNVSFNRTQPKDRTIPVTFAKPEIVRIDCDLHSWMVGWVVVTKAWAKRYPHTLAAFYKALLGLKEVSRPGNGGINLGLGGGFLGLYKLPNPGTVNHFCIGVDDFDPDVMAERLKAQGIAHPEALGIDAAGPDGLGDRRRGNVSLSARCRRVICAGQRHGQQAVGS